MNHAAVVPVDLSAVFSLEPGHTDALDWFVGSCLYDGGVWESPRTSDGIQRVERVLDRAPDCLRVCGRIYEIDQTLHTFWLELKRDRSEHISWLLYFDVAELSSRRAQNALDSCDRAEDIQWRATLNGAATVQDGELTIVPGSTRVLVQDMPETEPSDQRRRRRARGDG